MNRQLRRLQQFGKRFSARRSHGTMAEHGHDIFDASRPPDVVSPLAKSSRHGKVTAEKWNQ